MPHRPSKTVRVLLKKYKQALRNTHTDWHHIPGNPIIQRGKRIRPRTTRKSSRKKEWRVRELRNLRTLEQKGRASFKLKMYLKSELDNMEIEQQRLERWSCMPKFSETEREQFQEHAKQFKQKISILQTYLSALSK